MMSPEFHAPNPIRLLNHVLDHDSRRALDAIAGHVTQTIDRINRVEMTLRIAGRILPKTPPGPLIPYYLAELDVSTVEEYAIIGFEVQGVRAVYPL